MTDGTVIAWQTVREPRNVNGDTANLLATVDALRHAWEDSIALATAEEFAAARVRNLRRHAIETGIIERLYDVAWGVTEALVADGLSAEVAAREGGIGEGALDVIRSQFDALTFLAETARDDRAISAQLIRELHAALCRTQLTYDATDSLGRVVHRELHHGQWKQLPNQARRPDGSVLQFVPPEHVQSEIDRLIELDGVAANSLPALVRAAWLHHSFACIHPFEDGNGRVARALTILVLLRDKFAPLVVDRFSREEYISSLDAANSRDLRPLVRLFARLEIVALRSELERPGTALRTDSSALGVAAAQVDRIRGLRASANGERVARTESLAAELNGRVGLFLEGFGDKLRHEFLIVDPAARVAVYNAQPPRSQAAWWRAQTVRAAKNAGFFANLAEGAWWQNLRFSALGTTMRFTVVTQKVGQGETGVLAITMFAEAVGGSIGDSSEPAVPYSPLLSGPDVESATLTYTENLDDRWEGIEAMLDHALALVISRFSERLA